MAEPSKLPEHVEQVGEEGYVCRHCHGGVGDDGYALTLTPEEETEPPQDEAREEAAELAFADAVAGMP